MNPLTSVKGSIVTGFVLAAIRQHLAHDRRRAPMSRCTTPSSAAGCTSSSGVMWIGLLYYFNVVQVPGLADAAADKGGPGGAGISKYIAPRALFWFRWAAVATWITGAWYLGSGFGDAGAFGKGIHAAAGLPHDRRRRLARHDHAVQRLGLHLAEPEEDPRASCRQPTSRRPPRARPRCSPRAPISSCPSRC